MNDLPDPAPPALEEQMEAADLPESDRDEIRRFAEYLRRRKAVRAGGTPPPDPALRKWLTGEDVAPAPEDGRPARCPTCGSPNPAKHPAVQWEGEVEMCRDAWHRPPPAPEARP